MLLSLTLVFTGAWLLPMGEDAVGDGLARPATVYAATAATPKVGDTVYFGRYPQGLASASNPNTRPSNGTEGRDWVSHVVYTYSGDYHPSPFGDPSIATTAYYKVAPIEWRVLDNANGKLFLLAEKALDSKPYHTEGYLIRTWETCTLRSWLNGYSANSAGASAANPYADSFIGKAFTAGEKNAVATTAVQNPDNPKYGTSGGNDTNDKVFLLSYQEAINPAYGFSSSYSAKDTKRQAQTTPFDRANRGYADEMTDIFGNGLWWLRSPGSYYNSAVRVDYYGRVNNAPVEVSGRSVRPALFLNLNSVTLASTGSNTWTAKTSDTPTLVDPQISTATKLKPPTKLTLAAKKKSLLVKWTKPTNAAKQQLTGYQIHYRYKIGKKWSKWKTKTITVSYKATAKTAKATLKKLKSGKTYQVQIRAYKITGTGKAKQQDYSKWTKSKSKRVR